MSKLNQLILAGLIGLMGLSPAAMAHPKLTRTAPEANATVAASPGELRLTFSEALEASVSGADIKDKDGNTIATGRASTDPKDSKQLVIPLPTALAAGTYNVIWHAVAEDSHKVKGAYSFTVKP